MLNESWVTAGRALAWVTAVALLGATILFAYRAFAPLGEGEPPADFVERLLYFFEAEQARWPLEMISTLMFVVGLFALGGLGPVLRRVLGPDDARSAIASISFIGAGALGAASQLSLLGARQVTLDPTYCDCNYLAEEVIGRAQAMNVIGNAQGWLVNGLSFLAIVGLVLAAVVTLERGPLVRGWAWLSLATAFGFAVTVVASQVATFEVWSLLIALTAGILTPVWAIWLGVQLRDLEVGVPAAEAL